MTTSQAPATAAGASPLGEFGWQVMPGHLPGVSVGLAMLRPGNGCAGSDSRDPPGGALHARA